MEKATIKDIARITGLSKGTVDRVLHNRGEVSKKSYQKVMDAVKELGYQPNLYASLLAKSQARTIALLLPSPEPGSYWELAASGMMRARTELQALSVSTTLFTYNQYSEEAFHAACAQVLESSPAGVLLAPLFKNETLAFARQLQEAGIPYAYIDTKPDDDSSYLVYYGIPAYKSGYFCADMLTAGEKVSEVLVVRIRRDKEQQSDPTVYRRAGFMEYIQEHFPKTTVRQLFIDPQDPVATDDALNSFFTEFPKVHHIVMFNSRIHLLVPYLERNPIWGLRVIGFDSLAANIAALKRGTVTMLIAQRPDQQVQRALTDLANAIVLQRQPERQDNYMHMLLLTRFNVDPDD